MSPILMVWLAALAHAPAAAAASLGDRLPGHPDVTSFDLARLVVPDLVSGPDGATGHKVVAYRHIGRKDRLAPPEDPIILNSDAVDLMAVPGRPDRIVALIDLGPSDENVEEAEVLGLYALGPKPRLLDVVEVGNDRWTGVESDHPPMLGPGSPLIAVDSGHSNSNESFNSTELIFPRGDRFQPIDSLSTFSGSFCSFERTQALSFRAVASPGPYRGLEVSVRETVKLSGETGCTDQKPPRRGGVHVYQGVYRWDAAKGRFVTHSKALDALAGLTKARMEGP